MCVSRFTLYAFGQFDFGMYKPQLGKRRFAIRNRYIKNAAPELDAVIINIIQVQALFTIKHVCIFHYVKDFFSNIFCFAFI
jgi:hypothetical protein